MLLLLCIQHCRNQRKKIHFNGKVIPQNTFFLLVQPYLTQLKLRLTISLKNLGVLKQTELIFGFKLCCKWASFRINNVFISLTIHHWENSDRPEWEMMSIKQNKTYACCWWRLCRAPWSEEGQACPWGTPSATRLRHGRCAPRPAAHQCRDQTPHVATRRKEDIDPETPLPPNNYRHTPKMIPSSTAGGWLPNMSVVVKYIHWSFISRVDFKVQANENSHAQGHQIRMQE